MVVGQDDGRQAWIVLSFAAVVSLAILVLGVDATLTTIDQWRDARVATGAAERATVPTARETRVLTPDQLEAVRQTETVMTPATILGDPARYFAPTDYPLAALRAGEQGRTVALLTVGATGNVRACAILRSSGSAALDDATCRRADDLRFTPARNAEGAPVASDYRLPVRWQLPD